MLDSLITSKTRIKLLLKFFLNSQTKAYLRNLETEFGESTNAIRQELNRFEKAGLLSSEVSGNKKVYQANTEHPFYTDIHKILLKYIGIDKIIDDVLERIGNLKKAYITGDFAMGKTAKIIDIILEGDDFDYAFLSKLVQKAEENTSLKIRYLTISPNEESLYLNDKENRLLIWSAD
jgi:DNA-binding PadR family transcriptional regulator